MRYTTHIAFGSTAVLAIAMFTGRPLALFLGSIAGSLMPDIDSPDSYIGKRIPILPDLIYNIWGHRTITHSLYVVLAIGIFTLMLPFLNIKMMYQGFFHGFWFGYVFHILADCLNPSGVRLFYPERQRLILCNIEIKSTEENWLFNILILLTAALGLWHIVNSVKYL